MSDEVRSKAEAAREEGCPHANCVAHSMVKGALAELDTPEQRKQIEAIIQSAVADILAQASRPEQLAQVRMIAETAARSAVQGFLGSSGEMPTVGSIADQTANAMRRSLGDDGDGPLANSLAATAERVSASTVRGIRGEASLFPECSGPDRARCVEERLTQLSRAASIGVREGLRGLIAVPLVAFSFLLGLVVALLLSRIWPRRTPTAPAEPMRLRSHTHASAH